MKGKVQDGMCNSEVYAHQPCRWKKTKNMTPRARIRLRAVLSIRDEMASLRCEDLKVKLSKNLHDVNVVGL